MVRRSPPRPRLRIATRGRDRSDPEDRGFFERAGDEIASWFGDDDAERTAGATSIACGPAAARRVDRGREHGAQDGDYGRSRAPNAAVIGPIDWRLSRRAPRAIDPALSLAGASARSTSSTATMTTIAARTSRGSKSDFGSWRERRQQKRGLLGQIREHMEVVGNDEQHVGTVDRVAGDRIILTKSRSGKRRRAPFAELLGHRPGRGRPRDPRLLGRPGEASAGATRAAAARCSSARTRARWARACSIAASQGTYR